MSARFAWIPLLFATVMGCAPDAGQLDAPELAADDDVQLANDDPAKLLVYTSNIENLARGEVAAGDPESCRGDWQDLFFFMASAERAPDVVLFQQITDKTQLEEKVIARLEELTGEDYAAVIAEEEPAYWDEADCSAKRYQTNAIVFRTSRFQFVDGTKKVWRSRAADGDACDVAKASRYVNVAVKLADRLRPRADGSFDEVAVGSIHWPVVDGCGATNAAEADEVMQSYTGAQLYLFGGDVNLPELSEPEVALSGYRPWYRRLNLGLGEADNLGYVDPIYQACAEGAAGDPGALDACLIGNATMRFGSRYDFLFAKYRPSYNPSPVTTSGAHTVGLDEAGAADLARTGSDNAELGYSMHKSVSAYVHW